MAIDIFTPRTMLKALTTHTEVNLFLLATLFNTIETSDTENVDIDIVKGDQRLAPFVAPIVEGKLVEDQGFKTNTYKPPYIKPKFVTKATQFLKERSVGASIYGGDTPAQRAANRLAKEIVDGQNQITRREEWMAAQALTTGTITVQGDGLDYVIDFGMAADHKITLLTTDRWTQDGDGESDPIADLKAWSKLIQEDGDANADILIGGYEAIDALVTHANIAEILDTRRIDLGLIDPRQLQKGVVYFGTIKATGVNIDVYSYTASYSDENGDRQYYIPINRVVLTSRDADFRRNFAAIQDLDANFVPLPIFIKSWEEKDPSGRVVLMQSAPLPAPHQIDAIVTAQVV